MSKESTKSSLKNSLKIEESYDISNKRKHKVGRPVDNVWNLFTDSKNAFNIKNGKSAECKNCHQIVIHHNKVLSVKSHLNKCQSFRKKMIHLEKNQLPDWFDEIKQKRKPKEIEQKKQKQIHDYTIKDLTVIQQKKINEEIAMYFYATGTPFQNVEQNHLLNAFKICRPNVALPSKKMLSGKLLDTCYEKVVKSVNETLSNLSFISLTSDGWSNVENQPFINYMAISVTKKKCYFLDSVFTKDQTCKDEWIVNDISRIIDTNKLKISGIITDNSNSNKGAWKILKQKYPNIFFHGCVCHFLNLLVKDILSPSKISKNLRYEPDYQENFPFEDLVEFINCCSEVVSFFSNTHIFKEKLANKLQSEGKKNLVSISPTRWDSAFLMLESIMDAESILHSIVTEMNFISGNSIEKLIKTSVFNTITGLNFIPLMNEAMEILKPIYLWLKSFQDDNVAISCVYHAFLELQKSFQKINCNKQKKSYLLKLVKDRFDFIYGEAHGLGYILDPRYLGDEMDLTLRINIEEFLFGLHKFEPGYNQGSENNTQYNVEKIAEEYTAWRIFALNERDSASARYKRLLSGKKTIIQYWESDCHSFSMLKQIALKIFSIVPSTSKSERCFSTFEFCHSKLQNKLSSERIHKLLYIKINEKQLKSDGDQEISDCLQDNISEGFFCDSDK